MTEEQFERRQRQIAQKAFGWTIAAVLWTTGCLFLGAEVHSFHTYENCMKLGTFRDGLAVFSCTRIK